MPPRKVLELHGTIRAVTCTRCHARSSMEEALARVTAGEADPACLVCGGILKSATVMFGERLDPQVLGTALGVAKAADVFLAVGTTLQVQPAASLAGMAAEHGARLIIINAEPTPYDELADEVIREPIGTRSRDCWRTRLTRRPVRGPAVPGPGRSDKAVHAAVPQARCVRGRGRRTGSVRLCGRRGRPAVGARRGQHQQRVEQQ